jgi:hypothetical protein
VPAPRRFLMPATGLWILGLDWLLFSQNSLSFGLATPIVAAAGFLLGAAGTFFFQRRYGHDSIIAAGLKGLFAGAAVGIPWPIIGTLIGTWVLLASGLSIPADGAREASERRHPD